MITIYHVCDYVGFAYVRRRIGFFVCRHTGKLSAIDYNFFFSLSLFSPHFRLKSIAVHDAYDIIPRRTTSFQLTQNWFCVGPTTDDGPNSVRLCGVATRSFFQIDQFSPNKQISTFQNGIGTCNRLCSLAQPLHPTATAFIFAKIFRRKFECAPTLFTVFERMD